MAKGGVPLRYLATRMRLAVDEFVHSANSNTVSLSAALSKGLQAYQRELTGLVYITGTAMAPTLNAKASSSPEAVEKLLVRWIPRPSPSNTFVGDVVAFNSPLSRPDPSEAHVIVRRIAATEGEEMVSDDPEDVSWRVPEGHCWVLADNEGMTAAEAIDSRSFGPLPFDRILGRILYSASSPTVHGIVENSEEAALDDGPVLAAELDVEKFISDNSS